MEAIMFSTAFVGIAFRRKNTKVKAVNRVMKKITVLIAI